MADQIKELKEENSNLMKQLEEVSNKLSRAQQEIIQQQAQKALQPPLVTFPKLQTDTIPQAHQEEEVKTGQLIQSQVEGCGNPPLGDIPTASLIPRQQTLEDELENSFRQVTEDFPSAKFKQIYDATEDGWAVKNFHSACDDKGPTLTYCQTSAGHFFCAFTRASWESVDASKTCKDTFIYSGIEDKKYRVKEGQSAIYCKRSTGPCFGTNTRLDLIIASEPNKLSNSSKSQAKKSSFSLAPGANSNGPALTGGQENFVITKFIVFKVNKQ